MSLAIHHLDCRYTVPRNGEPEQRVRERLDRAATNELPNALRRSAQAGDADGALCFIERIEIDTILDTNANDYNLAQRWAESLWAAVARRLRNGERVIVFRRRSDYVSAFVLDLVDGAAEQVWYYRELLTAGLTAPDQAMRALTADIDAGREALIEIHRQNRLREVLRWLGESRVEAVVAACLVPSSPDFVPAGAPRRWLEAIRRQRFVPSGHAAADTAMLYLQVLRDAPELGPDVNLGRFVAAVLALARIDGLAPLLRNDVEWDCIRPRLATVAQARFLRTLLQTVPPADVAAVIEELKSKPEQSSGRMFETEHAGVFLLASSVLDLEVAEDSDEWRALLFFTLTRALGRRDDATIAAFCGLGRAPDERFDDELLAPVASRLLRHFARRLGAFDGSSAAYLYRTFLRGDGVVTLSEKRIAVRFLTCPMRVILRMAGFGSEPLPLPWAAGARLELDLD